MTTKRPAGLGRGLGELFQRTDLLRPDAPRHSTNEATAPENGPVDAPGTSTSSLTGPVGAGTANQVPVGSFYAELPVDAIRTNPRQPRTVFGADELAELVESVREVGVLQPVVVRPLAEGAFELVMGERRLRACKDAGLETIPAIVRETEDHDLLRDALLENLHRAELNPLEEAAAYQQMLEDFGCTQDELARRIQRSRPQISNTIRLLRLPPTVQRRVAAGVLSAGHARALLVIDDPAGQERLAQRVVAEGLSVRAVEELVTLGETGVEPRAGRAPRETPLRASELSDRLSDRFDTRVKVQMGKARGRISIEFASEDDLDRIIGLLDPSDQNKSTNRYG